MGLHVAGVFLSGCVVRLRVPLFAVAVLWSLLFSPALAQYCVGDCDRDDEVAVDELVRCVNIALGNLSVGGCLPCDRNAGGSVTVEELVQAVNNALSRCSIIAPSYFVSYPGPKFGVGEDPNSVAVADFNGDRVPDLVTANGGDISVLLGVGDGSFTPEQRYGTDGDDVAVADFNGDGVPDLVTASSYGDAVSVFIGASHGK